MTTLGPEVKLTSIPEFVQLTMAQRHLLALINHHYLRFMTQRRGNRRRWRLAVNECEFSTAFLLVQNTPQLDREPIKLGEHVAALGI
jgi:hypothetical protein